MITPIQCATMHSGLTEQEVKEKYGWVLRALNEYGSRCVYDFLEDNSPEPAKHKPFIVGNVRDILDELKEEITFGLFVEKLNAIASKFYEGASEGMAGAVKFAKFLADNDYRPGSGNKHWFKWNGMEVDETPLTLEQVYQIFASLSPGVEDKGEDGKSIVSGSFSYNDMLGFADYLRNGLTNMEYCQKKHEEHLEYWCLNYR